MLTLFPEVQQRAHAEIDRVVGSDRLPEFSDEDRLPYVTAIIKEIVRWAAFVPFGAFATHPFYISCLSLRHEVYLLCDLA